MIWKIEFKNIKAKRWFEKYNKYAKPIHNHQLSKDDFEMDSDFIYDMGYLGYAEAESQKKELKKHGITKLNQIRVCDIDGDVII